MVASMSKIKLQIVQGACLVTLLSIIFISPIVSDYLYAFFFIIFLNGTLANMVSVGLTMCIPFLVVCTLGIRIMNDLESKTAPRDGS